MRLQCKAEQKQTRLQNKSGIGISRNDERVRGSMCGSKNVSICEIVSDDDSKKVI